MFKKKQIIFLVIILIICIGVGGVGAYKVFTTKTKPKMMSDFQSYITEHKKNSENYILGKNEVSYKSLIDEGEQCINDGNLSKIEDIKSRINRLEDVIASDNTYSLNLTLDELKKVDQSSWDYAKVNDFNNKIDEINSFIPKKKFTTAAKKIQELKSNFGLNENTKLSSDAKTDKVNSNNTENSKVLLASNSNPALDAAKTSIFKEDATFANKEVSSGSILYAEDIKPNTVTKFNINEDVFYFAFNNEKLTKNSGLTSFYYVGKTSNNVYRCSSPNSSSSELYLIKNNSIVKTFK